MDASLWQVYGPKVLRRLGSDPPHPAPGNRTQRQVGLQFERGHDNSTETLVGSLLKESATSTIFAKATEAGMSKSGRLARVAAASVAVALGIGSAAGAKSCPEGMQPTNEFRIFFGVDGDAGTVSETQWMQFLATEVTPRFPAGLTVFDGTGQWLDPSGELHHDTVKIVMAAVPGETDIAVAREVASEYIDQFGQLAVFQMWNSSCSALIFE